MCWCSAHVVLCVWFVCLRLVSVCPVLPVSQDFPFLIAPSVFSNFNLVFRKSINSHYVLLRSSYIILTVLLVLTLDLTYTIILVIRYTYLKVSFTK